MFLLLLLLLTQQPGGAPRGAAKPSRFEQVVRQAETEEKAGHLQNAIHLYTEGVSLRPAWTDGWWSLGNLYYGQNRFPEARDALAHVVATAKNPGPALALLGLCEYETRDFDRAAEHLAKWAQQGSPGEDELVAVANLHRAQLLTSKEHYAEALALLTTIAHKRGSSPALTEAVGLAGMRLPTLPETYDRNSREAVWLRGKVEVARMLQQPEAAAYYSKRPALLAWRSVTSNPNPADIAELPRLRLPLPAPPPNSPTDFDSLAAAAAQYRQDHLPAEAMRDYERALKLRPEWTEGLWYLGGLQYDVHFYSESRDTMRRFVALVPDDGPGWALLGIDEFHTREYPRSLDHLQRALGLGVGADRKSATTVKSLIAALLIRFEQYDPGLGWLVDMARDGVPEDQLFESAGLAALQLPLVAGELSTERAEMVRMAGAGILALQLQRVEEAEKTLSQLATKYPDEPGVHHLLGIALINSRPEDGTRELQREIAINPLNIPALMRLSEQFLVDGQPEKALPLAQQAVKFAPSLGSAHRSLGEVHLAQRNTAAAVRELEKARDLAPQVARIRMALFRAYSAAGRTADAQREKAEVERLTKPVVAQ